jgi:hypothetical protein
MDNETQPQDEDREDEDRDAETGGGEPGSGSEPNVPFEPHEDDDSELGDTDQHSDA